MLNSKKHKRKDKLSNQQAHSLHEQRKIVGRQMNFAASEAYKLLRTNLIFSMSDENKCKVIGITSALRGEGKSTTSINTAFSLAETQKKVLLIEADMRIPVVAKLLRFNQRMGLSNVLAGVCEARDVISKSPVEGRPYIMTAGEIPPNPAELLASEKMKKVITELSEDFDYIIVDLPPITAVSDGLAISKLLSGMIVVVRQNYCNRRALADAMRQMDFLQVKVLGFVVNCVEIKQRSYKKYSYSGKDGYSYRHPYVTEDSPKEESASEGKKE